MAIDIKDNGIYERRDGRIAGPVLLTKMGAYKWGDKNNAWLEDGRFSEVPGGNALDLVREIVVGPGWMPWNGGGEAPLGKNVVCIRRDIPGECSPSLAEWNWAGRIPQPYDILAYRIIEEAETAKEDGRDEWQRKSNAALSKWKPESAGQKLRADMPGTWRVEQAHNGGFIVIGMEADEIGCMENVIAAVSNDSDLLAWLTEDVKS